jgi:hypothetical protein
VKGLLIGPSPQRRETNRKIRTKNKYKMSNNKLVIYTGYQYRVDVQGYEVIEVDMYIYCR